MFSSRIHICFWVLYVLMIKLVAMATILEGDVLQANYLCWPHAAMCGRRHVVLYFLTLVRIITADFLWIRITGTAKIKFFIFWSWGLFRWHGNQIRTRRWHTEVRVLPFPNIYRPTLPNLLGWFVIYGKILLFCLGLTCLKCKKMTKNVKSWKEFIKCANMYCIFE